MQTGSLSAPMEAPGGARTPPGLTRAEAEARRRRGLGNDLPLQTTRSYRQILRENVFTFINTSLFVLGLALVMLDRPADALVSVGVVTINVMVSAVQEIRAKRNLDRIALLTRPTANVIRDGQEEMVDPSEVVLGDTVMLRPGDQAVADGRVISGRADMDESLLTGESEVVPKQAGDTIYSGSFCVNGSAIFEAEKVGAASTASKMTATARAFRRVATPLQFYVAFVVRVLLLVAVFIEMLLFAVNMISNTPVVTGVQNAVVVVGLVPQGLFLSITVAYAMGAVRIAGQAILIQQSNAIESLSNADVLCLDKTGTLTANRIRLERVRPVATAEDVLRSMLGDFAASVSTGNRTSDALADACPGERRRVTDEVVFSSDRKWSGLTIEDTSLTGTFILGAPEILRSHVVNAGSGRRRGWAGGDLGPARGIREWGDEEQARSASAFEEETWDEVGESWAGQGLRVVLFACAAPEDEGEAPGRAGLPLESLRSGGEPCLPLRLVPLGLVAFSDELRPEAAETLAHFREAGIEIKIISGDNPHTAAAIARRAGLGPEIRTMSGQKLAGMDAEQFAIAAESSNVFGRITPGQKADLVGALKQRGHYVAMTGDGINDIMALKQAHLGIAMETGSQASRAVADIVLLRDSFAALPSAFAEGQRIRNGMEDVLKLFLTRLLTVTLLVGAVGFVGGFPFTPRQISLVSFITVGVPTVVLAARAGTGMASTRSRLLSTFHFVLPAGLSLAMTSLTACLGVLYADSRALMASRPDLSQGAALEAVVPAAQSALALSLVLCGLMLVPFVVPPVRWWQRGGVVTALGSADRKVEVDWRPSAVALALLVLYVVIIATPPLRAFFELAPLTTVQYILIVAQSILWVVLIRWAWRSQVLERFLFGDMQL